MGSPSTSSVATEQPTSPVPSLGTTRRPVHHYSCGVNPGVKAPDSCRTGTSCLHSHCPGARPKRSVSAAPVDFSSDVVLTSACDYIRIGFSH